jgi:predicted dehydrogenase
MREPLEAELSAFAEACASGVAPEADGRHGLEVVRILAAIDASAAAGGAPVAVA